MIKHSILLFFRNFLRFKLTIIINVVGLSIALACSLLIFLWVYDESNVDKFHKNDAQLFKVMVNDFTPDGIVTRDAASGNLDAVLKNSFPEVRYAITTTPPQWFRAFNVSVPDNVRNVLKAEGNFVGADYFKVFSYDLIRGNTNTVLSAKNSVAISDELAIKLFNTVDNAIGKQLDWKWFSYQKQGIVTGVYKKMPENSTQQLDFLLSFWFWNELMPGSADPNIADISGGPFNTFIVLNKGVDAKKLSDKITTLCKSRVSNSKAKFLLAKYSDNYLHRTYENGISVGGKIQYVRLFSIIAGFILLIACINFMNLSTARASERVKEIGLKKTFGVSRRALGLQFLIESIAVTVIALLIACGIVILLLPYFNQITGKELEFSSQGSLVPYVLGIAIVTGVIAGIYPALYLSGLKPVGALKGKQVVSGTDIPIRRGLVFFQFCLSVVFIVLIFVITDQINFIQSKKLGFDKDNVFYFEMEGNVAERIDAFLAGLSKVPGVVNASTSQNSIIIPSFDPPGGVSWDGKNKDDKIKFTQMAVNYNLIETLNIDLVEGRSFSRSYGNDSNNVIINEAAAKAMGSAGQIKKTIEVWGKNMRVIGIVKNFHFNSLHEKIQPFIFRLEPKSTILVMVRIGKGNHRFTFHAIEKYYAEFNPGFSLDPTFLDSDFQSLYASEVIVKSLSKYFGALAILISCLGLFGLASFSAERRLKEIGIRKTLGATNADIVFTLAGEFNKIVVYSLVLGCLLSYIIATIWLNNFSYRIDLNIWYFLTAAAVVLVMAWMTIGYHALKASIHTPIHSLRGD